MKKFTIALLSILLVCTTCIPVYAEETVNPYPNIEDFVPSEGDGRYEEYFKDYINYSVESGNRYSYKEIYEYASSQDEANFVLVQCYYEFATPGEACIVIGDYVIEASWIYHPYSIGLFIFIPSEKKIMTLAEACKAQVSGLENIFTAAGLGRQIGDVNGDNVINIKDATELQKILAKKSSVEDTYKSDGEIQGYYSDFNRDGVRNIKDATAIQKYIAIL